MFGALAPAGRHIVSSKTIYGGTYNLLAHTLPLSGVTATFVDIGDPSAVEAAIRPETRLLFAETLGNPNSDVADVETLAAIAHRHGIPLVVDSTFATPYLLRPIEYGADVVVHSATKFIAGTARRWAASLWRAAGSIGRPRAGSRPSARPTPATTASASRRLRGPAALVTYIRAVLLRDTGAAISPFNAFLLLQGLETLSLRVERHVENALRVVDFLVSHPKVER